MSFRKAASRPVFVDEAIPRFLTEGGAPAASVAPTMLRAAEQLQKPAPMSLSGSERRGQPMALNAVFMARAIVISVTLNLLLYVAFYYAPRIPAPIRVEATATTPIATPAPTLEERIITYRRESNPQ